ncbi:MAG TPA: YXWGXW repeat-containing protein [Candidatus Baltobacteraceae bacterium]
MKYALFRPAVLAAIIVIALPRPALADVNLYVGINVGEPPPPIPVYEQPYAPDPNYIWAPGYWAWDPYAGGYYWVPGTWVPAPEPG